MKRITVANLWAVLVVVVLAAVLAVVLAGCRSVEWPAEGSEDPGATNGVALLAAVSWDRATRASCWDGPNAERRMMNCLSPKFSEAKVSEYLAWQQGRGCDTVDLILANQGDGEGAGYSIYGAAWDWKVDAGAVALMNARIERFRRAGMAVNVWLLTDDSTAWNRLALGSPERYAGDVARAGLLRQASSVCVGLELTEYATKSQVAAMVAALRGVYGGKVATHHNSGRLDFAALGDLVWIQESPGVTEAALGRAIDRAMALGKPVRCFEIDRKPNRALCEFALRRGCYAVGNW